MKSWTGHAHLFANGKFKCTWRHAAKDATGKIHGINFNGHNWLFKVDRGILGIFNESISDCTLIARKIEDMTDEESVKYAELQDPFVVSDTAESLLYLLSIGVYPFSQKDFENGTVIDINTL